MNNAGIFFEKNPNPMWVFAKSTLKIKAVNKAALDFYGYSEEEMLSLTLKDLRPKSEIGKLNKEIEKNQQGFSNAGTWLHQKKNGEQLYMRILSYPINWHGKECKLIVAQDLTEQKGIEKLLADEKEEYEIIAQNFPGTYYVFDEEGDLKRWNKKLEEITGYTNSEIKEMTPLGFIALSERDKVQDSVKKAFNSGSSEIESLLLTKEGKEIPFYFKTSKAVLHGKPHLIGVGVDISPLVKAREELKLLYENEKAERERTEILNNSLKLMNKVGTIFASENDLKIALDKIACLLTEDVSDICSMYLSKNEKLNRIAHHAASKEIEELAAKIREQYPDLMMNINLFNQVLEKGEAILQTDFNESQIEDFNLHSNPQKMVKKLGIKSFFLLPLNARKKTVGVLVLVIVDANRQFFSNDEYFLQELSDKIALHIINLEIEENLRSLNVTLEERVQTRTQQLEESNQELESFSYSVSHDLRAPLRAIAGYSNLLLEDHQQDMNDEGKEFLKIVHDETQRMGELIDKLLAFSRMGRTEKTEQTISMNLLVDSSIEKVKQSFPEKNIHFEVEELPEVTIDTRLMMQVWINLLDNAVKYYKPEDEPLVQVTSQLSEENNNIIFSIRDFGVGFDMKYSDKLFGVFQRLHSDDEFEGTGIGLALAQRIIKRHGGKIWAESEEGKGSTFYFTLPYK